jgi:hypothetical protein
VSKQRIDQLRLLVRVLFAAAAAALVLAVIAAIQIATSSTNIEIVGQIQQESRGVIALAVFGGGVVGAGILAALAGILTVLLDREQGPAS